MKKLFRTFGVCLVLTLVHNAAVAEPFENLTDDHKQLIEEFVESTGLMPTFRTKVRDYYHKLIFEPTEKMFVGTILENDPKAREIMTDAIDAALEDAFNKQSLKYVHYQIFSENYSEDELAELIKFYRTDVGKKTIEHDSALFRQWEKQRYKWARSLNKRIKDSVRDQLNSYHDQQLADSAK